jgi:hypothetical protein
MSTPQGIRVTEVDSRGVATPCFLGRKSITSVFDDSFESTGVVQGV